MVKKSVKRLDNRGDFGYNNCICKCCDGIIRKVRTKERERSVEALVRAAVADPSLCCENSDVSSALKVSSGRVRLYASIWVVSRSSRLRPMYRGGAVFI